MPNESLYTLYSEPSIGLGPFVAADSEELWERLIEAATAASHPPVSWRLERLSQDRILRIVRTENSVPVAIHFLIVERRAADGRIGIRLQPVVAWQDETGGGTRAMRVPDATVILTRLRAELGGIADSVDG